MVFSSKTEKADTMRRQNITITYSTVDQPDRRKKKSNASVLFDVQLHVKPTWHSRHVDHSNVTLVLLHFVALQKQEYRKVIHYTLLCRCPA